MTAKDFIDLLAEKELLAQRTLAKLRQQIQSAGKPVSARAVAKALVKSGQLTEDQARRLLQQLAQAAKKQATKTPSAQAETETPPSAEAP